MPPRSPLPPALVPALWSDADIAAIKAMSRGEATAHQQGLALKWIIEAAADTYGETYRPDPYDHAFLSGRRNVGLQIVKLINMPAALVEKLRSKNG
jgi:hypothetical protein